MGEREYARHRKCALSTVQAAIKSDRIPVSRDEKGRIRIDPALADPAWEANTDPSKRNRKGAQPPPPAVPAATAPAKEAKPKALNYYEAKALKEEYLARLRQLEFEIKSGKLVPVANVEKQAFRTARAVRDALLKIPDRIAGNLAGESDAHRVHQMLLSELNTALGALAEILANPAPEEAAVAGA